ncbi:MAG: hypothetical protein LBJ10_10180, partial [Clostridiales bacterium]|nr:hypothetical protein [Clostridiales bacterium]
MRFRTGAKRRRAEESRGGLPERRAPISAPLFRAPKWPPLPFARSVFTQFLLTYLAVVMALALPLAPIYGITYANARQSILKENSSALQNSLSAIENDILSQIAISASLSNGADFQSLLGLDGYLPQEALGSATNIRDILRYAGSPSDIVFMSAVLFRRCSLMITGDKIHMSLGILNQNYMRTPSLTYGQWEDMLFRNAAPLGIEPQMRIEYRDSVMNPFLPIDAVHFIARLPAGGIWQIGAAGELGNGGAAGEWGAAAGVWGGAAADGWVGDAAALLIVDAGKMFGALATDAIRERGFLFVAAGAPAGGRVIYSYNISDGDVEGGAIAAADAAANAAAGGAAFGKGAAASGVGGQIVWAGEKTAVIRAESGRLGLAAVAGIPVSVFGDSVSNIANLLLGYLAISLLLGILLAPLLAYRQTKPVDGLISAIAELSIVPDAGGGAWKKTGFAFIRDAIVQLGSKGRQYEEQLSTLQDELTRNLTEKILSGGGGDSEINEFARRCGFARNGFAVAYMSCGAPEAALDGEALGRLAQANVPYAHALHRLAGNRWALIVNLDI